MGFCWDGIFSRYFYINRLTSDQRLLTNGFSIHLSQSTQRGDGNLKWHKIKNIAKWEKIWAYLLTPAPEFRQREVVWNFLKSFVTKSHNFRKMFHASHFSLINIVFEIRGVQHHKSAEVSIRGALNEEIGLDWTLFRTFMSITNFELIWWLRSQATATWILREFTRFFENSFVSGMWFVFQIPPSTLFENLGTQNQNHRKISSKILHWRSY